MKLNLKTLFLALLSVILIPLSSQVKAFWPPEEYQGRTQRKETTISARKANKLTEVEKDTTLSSLSANNLLAKGSDPQDQTSGMTTPTVHIIEESCRAPRLFYNELLIRRDIGPENQKVYKSIKNHLSSFLALSNSYFLEQFFSIQIQKGKILLSIQKENYNIIPQDGELEIISQNNILMLRYGNSYAEFKTALKDSSEDLSICINENLIDLFIAGQNFRFPILNEIIEFTASANRSTLWVGKNFRTSWGASVKFPKNIDEVEAGIIESLENMGLGIAEYES